MGAVIVAARYVPRPPDDNLVNIKSGKIPAVLPQIGGNYPFKPQFFRFGQDDSAFWLRSSFQVPPVRDLVGGNYPFKPTRWKNDYQEQNSFWSSKSFNEPLTLTLPIVLAPFVPSRWAFNYDPPREWVGGPSPAFSLLSQTLQLYAPTSIRPFPIGDDGDKWSGNRQTVNNLLLNTAVVVNPFLPTAWRFDHQDQNYGWVAKSQPVPPVNRLVGGNFPFVPVRWKFDFDDASLWTVKTAQVPKVQLLVGGGFPIVPVRPQFNYHDAPSWHAKPVPVTRSLFDLLAGNPFVPPRWKYDLDDPGRWIGKPTPVSRQLIALLAGNPFAPKRWAFNYHDAPVWLHPVPRNGFNVNQPAAAITIALSATETPDTASFTASFLGIWTPSTQETELWTPATIQAETWTPE